MKAEPYRALPYADPTGNLAAARADRDTTARPRKDGRTFRKVDARGVQEAKRAA